jgi:MFS family permease
VGPRQTEADTDTDSTVESGLDSGATGDELVVEAVAGPSVAILVADAPRPSPSEATSPKCEVSETSRGASSPFPWLRVAIICGTVAANSISLFLLLPTVPFMVRGFMPQLSPQEVGYATGALEGIFHVGQLGGAVAWGAFADRFGRRPSMLGGLVGTVVSCLLFGFAQSYSVAMVARLLWGLLNANIGVAKTMLVEVSGPEHQTRAFAMFASVSAFGRLVGPSIGGLLAMPATTIGGPFRGVWLWETYPFLLPCLVASSLTFLVLIASWITLTETLPTTSAEVSPTRRDELDTASDEEGPVTGTIELAPLHRDGLDSRPAEEETTDLIAPPPQSQDEETTGLIASARAGSDARLSWQTLIRDKHVLRATGLYGVISFIGQSSEECLPLTLLNDAAHGGLSMGPPDIGTTNAAVGLPLLFFQLFLYPWIAHRWGVLTVLRTCVVSFACALVLVPLITQWFALADPPSRWLAGAAASIFLTLSRVPLFPTTFVLISNSSPSKMNLALVNGIGQSLCSLGRILGPPLFSAVLAWGTSFQGMWPLNHHLAWDSLALITLAALLPLALSIREHRSAG